MTGETERIPAIATSLVRSSMNPALPEIIPPWLMGHVAGAAELQEVSTLEDSVDNCVGQVLVVHHGAPGLRCFLVVKIIVSSTTQDRVRSPILDRP
jgi:hypothetical protein